MFNADFVLVWVLLFLLLDVFRASWVCFHVTNWFWQFLSNYHFKSFSVPFSFPHFSSSTYRYLTASVLVLPLLDMFFHFSFFVLYISVLEVSIDIFQASSLCSSYVQSIDEFIKGTLDFFSIFKCTVQWCEVHSYCYITITTIHHQNNFPLAKLNSIPIKS